MSSALSRIEYFEILSDLEVIAETRCSVPSLLARWDGELSDSDGPTTLKLGNVTLAFRETIVGILQKFLTPKVDLEGYLAKMRWQSLCISREQGELEFADGCLKRLEKGILNSHSESRLPYMKLRLEEAKLMERRGYLKPAVQITKLIVHSACG